MPLRPTEDRVVVELLSEDRSIGGILIPETAKKNSHRGRVVAVGPGKFDNGWFVPPSPVPLREEADAYEPGLKAGDVVHFGEWAGVKVTDPADRKEYRVMAALECLCVEEPA